MSAFPSVDLAAPYTIIGASSMRFRSSCSHLRAPLFSVLKPRPDFFLGSFVQSLEQHWT